MTTYEIRVRGRVTDALMPLFDGCTARIEPAGTVQALVELSIDPGGAWNPPFVDELRLMVFPVLLGRGKRLFASDADMRRFELVDSTRSSDVTLLTLRRKSD